MKHKAKAFATLVFGAAVAIAVVIKVDDYKQAKEVQKEIAQVQEKRVVPVKSEPEKPKMWNAELRSDFFIVRDEKLGTILVSNFVESPYDFGQRLVKDFDSLNLEPDKECETFKVRQEAFSRESDDGLCYPALIVPKGEKFAPDNKVFVAYYSPLKGVDVNALLGSLVDAPKASNEK